MRCCRAGFSVPMTGHAISLIDSYIYGFVLQEVNLPFDDSSELEEVVGEILPELSPENFPHLLELTTEYVLQPGYSYGNEFYFGLVWSWTGWRRRRAPDPDQLSFLEQRGTRGGATYRLSASLTPPAGLQLNREELDDVIAELAIPGPIRIADVRRATGLDRSQAR